MRERIYDYHFVFYLPHYISRSNGISTLYLMAADLSENGFKVSIVRYGNPNKEMLPLRFLEFVKDEKWLLYNSCRNLYNVAVYPDVVDGNPLKTKYSIRALMAVPGLFGGSGLISDSPTEYLMAFSHAIHSGLPQIYYLKDEVRVFEEIQKTKRNSSRVGIYYGKSRKGVCIDKMVLKLIKSYSDRVAVTRFWPQSRSQTLDILASSDLMVCHDPLSYIAYEATLCGTPVLITDPLFKKEYDHFNHELPGFFYDPHDLQMARLAVRRAMDIYKENVALNSSRVVNAFSDASEYFDRLSRSAVSVNEYKTISSQYVDFKRAIISDMNIKLQEMGSCQYLEDSSLIKRREIGIRSYMCMYPQALVELTRILVKKLTRLLLDGNGPTANERSVSIRKKIRLKLDVVFQSRK